MSQWVDRSLLVSVTKTCLLSDASVLGVKEGANLAHHRSHCHCHCIEAMYRLTDIEIEVSDRRRVNPMGASRPSSSHSSKR